MASVALRKESVDRNLDMGLVARAQRSVDYGQRVQNSVFECLLDAAQYTMFKAKLTELIDSESDSLRFYQLGNHYKSKVEHVGLHPDFDQDGILFA